MESKKVFFFCGSDGSYLPAICLIICELAFFYQKILPTDHPTTPLGTFETILVPSPLRQY